MTLSVEGHVERLEVDGWTIVENAIDSALIDTLDDALHDLEELLGITPTANTFEGANTKRVFNLLAHEGPWPEVPTHPAIAPIIRGVLGEGFQISSLASVSIGPGEAAQPIHADDQMMRIAKPHFPTVCNTMWALTERLAPGGVLGVIIATETNLERNEKPGRPFLLDAGELPGLVPDVEVLHHSETWRDNGRHEAHLVGRAT